MSDWRSSWGGACLLGEAIPDTGAKRGRLPDQPETLIGFVALARLSVAEPGACPDASPGLPQKSFLIPGGEKL